MIIFTCINSGAEVVSDAYPTLLPFGDEALGLVAFECVGKYVAKGGEDYGITNNDEEDGGGEEGAEQVIDIIDSFELQDLPFGKKDFQLYMKKYIKSIAASSTAEVQKALTSLFMTLVKKFDEISIKVPANAFDQAAADMNVAPVFEIWEGSDPHYIFIKTGLKEERV